MKKLVYFLFLTVVINCNSQNLNTIDPISPLRVEFKARENKVSICYHPVNGKAFVSIKLQINKALKISSVKLLTARYRNYDNEMLEIKDYKTLIKYFNSKKFAEKLNINLTNEKFDDFPYKVIVNFPVYLKNCE